MQDGSGAVDREEFEKWWTELKSGKRNGQESAWSSVLEEAECLALLDDATGTTPA